MAEKSLNPHLNEYIQTTCNGSYNLGVSYVENLAMKQDMTVLHVKMKDPFMAIY